MTIPFERVSKAVYDELISSNYSVDMYDENHNRVYDKSSARSFWAQPNDEVLVDKDKSTNSFMVSIHVDGDEKSKMKVKLSNGIDIEQFEQNVGRKLRGIATHDGQNMGYDIRSFGKSLTLKDCALEHSDIKEESVMNDDAINEGRAKWSGTTKSSYLRIGECRLIVRHTSRVNEDKAGSRTRNINSIFIETQHGERFRVKENNLLGAKALARHVSNGGTPYDTVGLKVTEMMVEMTELSTMLKETRKLVRKSNLSEKSEDLAIKIRERYISLRESLKKMSGKKGYFSHTATMLEAELMEKDDPKMDVSRTTTSEETPDDQTPEFDRPEGLDNLERDNAESLMSVNESKYGSPEEHELLESWFDEMVRVEYWDNDDLVEDDSPPSIEKILPETAMTTLNLYKSHPLFDHYMRVYSEQGILDEVRELVEEDSTLMEYMDNFEFEPYDVTMDRADIVAQVEELIRSGEKSLQDAIADLALKTVKVTGENLDMVESEIWSACEEAGLVKNDYGSTFGDDVMTPSDEIKKHEQEIEAEQYYGDAKFAEGIETVSEDWGSSDWGIILKSMNEYIERVGFSPDAIKQAAEEQASFYGEHMGYDINIHNEFEDCVSRICDMYMANNAKAQQAKQMFKSVDEDTTLQQDVELSERTKEAITDADLNDLVREKSLDGKIMLATNMIDKLNSKPEKIAKLKQRLSHCKTPDAVDQLIFNIKLAGEGLSSVTSNWNETVEPEVVDEPVMNEELARIVQLSQYKK